MYYWLLAEFIGFLLRTSSAQGTSGTYALYPDDDTLMRVVEGLDPTLSPTPDRGSSVSWSMETKTVWSLGPASGLSRENFTHTVLDARRDSDPNNIGQNTIAPVSGRVAQLDGFQFALTFRIADYLNATQFEDQRLAPRPIIYPLFQLTIYDYRKISLSQSSEEYAVYGYVAVVDPSPSSYDARFIVRHGLVINGQLPSVQRVAEYATLRNEFAMNEPSMNTFAFRLDANTRTIESSLSSGIFDSGSRLTAVQPLDFEWMDNLGDSVQGIDFIVGEALFANVPADKRTPFTFWISSAVLLLGADNSRLVLDPLALAAYARNKIVTGTVSASAPSQAPASSPAPSVDIALAVGVGGGVGGALMVIVGVALALYLRRRGRRRQARRALMNDVAYRIRPIPDVEDPFLPPSDSSRRGRATVVGEMLPDEFVPPEHQLTQESCLASGFFGAVYVFRGKADGALYALKVFETRTSESTVGTLLDYFKEISVLSSIRHPHIVDFRGHYIYPSMRPALVMNFEEGLSLDDYLYPAVYAVVPSSSDVAVAARAFKDLQAAVEHELASSKALGGFSGVRVEACFTDASVEGRRLLERAASGSRVRVIGSEQGQAQAGPRSPSLSEPCLVIYHGSSAYQWPLRLASDPTAALLDFLTQQLARLPKLTTYHRVRLAREAWEGVNFLHRQKPSIIHADLKPQNLLLDAQGRARVADVGLAQEINLRSSQGVSFMTDVHGLVGGTRGYDDPERSAKTPKYGEKNDVYSFGIVLLELFPASYTGPGELISKIVDVIVGALSPWEKRLRSDELLERLRAIHDLVVTMFPSEHAVQMRRTGVRLNSE